MSEILLVEDDENSVFMMCAMLRRLGHRVSVARDGEEGLAQVRTKRPDLILMDLSLPVMDGWDATRTLKSAPQTAAIPIIVLSAHAMPEVKQRALDLGADDFETKPVRIAELTGKIETLLNACKAAQVG